LRMDSVAVWLWRFPQAEPKNLVYCIKGAHVELIDKCQAKQYN